MKLLNANTGLYESRRGLQSGRPFHDEQTFMKSAKDK